MKKVYGLLVVLVLFVGCFPFVMAEEGEVIELFRVKDRELILKAKYESLDGQIVPKYIVTNKGVRIYEKGKEKKRIVGDGLYAINCTDDGEYFLCADGVIKDDRGEPESKIIKIFNSNGALVWSQRVQGLYVKTLIVNYKNSWGLFEWSEEDGFARFVNESSEKYLINSFENFQNFENFESVYDVKVGLSGMVVLSQKVVDKKWVLRSFDFDGNLHWEQEYYNNSGMDPILLVNKAGCFVLYPVKDQLCFRGYDESGTLLIENLEKYGEKSKYIRGTINEDYVFFSNAEVLKRFNMEKKKIDRTLTFNSDIHDLYADFNSLYVWKIISNSNNQTMSISLDCFSNDILKKNMVSSSLSKFYNGSIISINRIGNYIVVVQEGVIFAIKIK